MCCSASLGPHLCQPPPHMCEPPPHMCEVTAPHVPLQDVKRLLFSGASSTSQTLQGYFAECSLGKAVLNSSNSRVGKGGGGVMQGGWVGAVHDQAVQVGQYKGAPLVLRLVPHSMSLPHLTSVTPPGQNYNQTTLPWTGCSSEPPPETPG